MRGSRAKRRRTAVAFPQAETTADATAVPACAYCGTDLEHAAVHIVCAGCRAGRVVRLCIDCFSVGAEIDGHVADHPYRVAHPVDDPIFEQDWSAAEERRLLNGLLHNGMDKWNEVAEMVPTKSSAKCQAHYERVYLGTPWAPMPDVSRILPRVRGLQTAASPGGDDVVEDGPAEIDNDSATAGAERLGFMPKRGDFDVEYLDDAENSVADLEIGESDSAEERELKTRLLEIYNARLERRELAKQLVIERHLVPQQGPSTAESTSPPPYGDVAQHLDVLSRIATPDEHKTLQRVIAKERPLIDRIKTLLESSCTKCSTKSASGSPSVRRVTRRVAPILDVGAMEGADALSLSEREICAILRITPRRFVQVREAALAVSRTMGGSSESMLRVDLSRKSVGTDFSVSVIRANPDKPSDLA